MEGLSQDIIRIRIVYSQILWETKVRQYENYTLQKKHVFLV